jgi:2-succinyl-6-hydroxy-2,4-cyclohexadiene-1-carboxylate synthase
MHAKKLDVHGVGIQVEDHGEPGEAIVFIHHGGSNLRMWDSVVPFFANGFRPITLDLRGHGHSDAPATGYHIDNMAADVIGALDALSIEQAHIVGSSVGAEVGLSLAVNYSERIRSLVAEGAFHSEYGPYGTRDMESFDQDEALKSRLAERQASPETIYDSREELLTSKRAFYKDNALWNEAIDATLRYGIVELDSGRFVDAWRKHARDQYMQMYFGYRFEDYYARITCPILMLPDAEDAADATLWGIMTRLSQLCRHCEIARVPGAIHPFGWILDPAPMAQAVLGFFNRLS